MISGFTVRCANKRTNRKETINSLPGARLRYRAPISQYFPSSPSFCLISPRLSNHKYNQQRDRLFFSKKEKKKFLLASRSFLLIHPNLIGAASPVAKVYTQFFYFFFLATLASWNLFSASFRLLERRFWPIADARKGDDNKRIYV